MDAGSPTADDVLDRLRHRGTRLTTARRAVIASLVAADGQHITAEAIVAWVQARHPEVHRSTVYRTLDRLEAIGMVNHVHLGHGPSTYHLTDRPHHHAICNVCGTVIDVPPEALDGLTRRLRADHGFELTHQHFALSGRCRDCT